MQEQYEESQDLDYGLIDTNARINKWVTHFLISYFENQFETMNKCCNCITLEIKANMTKEEKDTCDDYKRQVLELMKKNSVRLTNWVESKKMMPGQTPPFTVDQNLENQLCDWFSFLKVILKRLKLDLGDKDKSGVI